MAIIGVLLGDIIVAVIPLVSHTSKQPADSADYHHAHVRPFTCHFSSFIVDPNKVIDTYLCPP